MFKKKIEQLKKLITTLKQNPSMIKKIIKDNIPNAISSSRFAMAVIVPFIFATGDILAIFLSIAATLSTDFIDGKLARKWGVVSKYGKFADAVSDKVFAASVLLASGITINPYMFAPFALEVIITGISIGYYKKTHGDEKKNNSALAGKIKMWPLGFSILAVILTLVTPVATSVLYPLLGLTLLTQGVTAYVYAKRLIDEFKAKKQVIEEPVIEEKVLELEDVKDEKSLSQKEKVIIPIEKNNMGKIQYLKWVKENALKYTKLVGNQTVRRLEWTGKNISKGYRLYLELPPKTIPNIKENQKTLNLIKQNKTRLQ